MENSKQTTNPLETEKISKLLLKFSVPTTLTLLVNYLYNIVDQIFVGQGVGIIGIAATNVAFPLTILCIAVALLIGDGCAANISLCLGRKEQKEANITFGNAFSMLIISSILAMIIGNIFLKQIVLLFGATETVFQSAVDYSRIIIIGLPFLMFNVAFTAIIRADGNPKYTMKSMMLGAVINLILDPVFIFKFNMGVKGAAIATIIGQIVSGIICLSYIKRLQNIQFCKADMKLVVKNCGKIISLGISSFVTQLTAALVQITMNNIMRIYGSYTVYGSDIALSCYGMMMKVYQIAHSMFVGVSSATQPINGYNYGAKLYNRVKQTYVTAACIALIISIVCFIVFQLLAGQIASLFVPNNQLYIDFAKYCFHLYMLAFFLYGVPMATASFFQAIGKPAKAIILSLSRQAIFLIPLALILSKTHGLDGALIAAPIADCLTFILACTFILREFRDWKHNGLLKN